MCHADELRLLFSLCVFSCVSVLFVCSVFDVHCPPLGLISGPISSESLVSVGMVLCQLFVCVRMYSVAMPVLSTRFGPLGVRGRVGFKCAVSQLC